MECQICSRIFSNGEALGGHMRSHYATLRLPLPFPSPSPPKTPQRQDQLITDQSTSSHVLSSCDEPESCRGRAAVSYPNKSIIMRSSSSADPVDGDDDDDYEFFDDVRGSGSGSGSADHRGQGGSDSEPTRGRRRLKKAKGLKADDDARVVVEKETRVVKRPQGPSGTEEADVALALVMLSNDGAWRGSAEFKVYKCNKCGRVFKSSQGLGSHRASHHNKLKNENIGGVDHECPVCGKMFRSAQALGGHKRSHLLLASSQLVEEGSGSTNDTGKMFIKGATTNTIDLNLQQAGVGDGDEVCFDNTIDNGGEAAVVVSVSDAALVNHIN